MKVKILIVIFIALFSQICFAGFFGDDEYDKSKVFFMSSIEKIKHLNKDASGFKEVEKIKRKSYKYRQELKRNDEGKIIISEFNTISSGYLRNTSIIILKKAIKDINNLPLIKSSYGKARSIKKNARDYGYALNSDKNNFHYVDDLDKAETRKLSTLYKALNNSKCSLKLPKSGLPKTLYKKRIIGIYANAIQYESNFKTIFCNILNNGHTVKYIKPKNGTTNYGIKISNDIGTTILIFAKLPNEKAWILKEIRQNGKKQRFTSKDALAFLIAISS